MSHTGSCEGCYFYQAIQEEVKDQSHMTQVYQEEAPDATPAQIEEANLKFRQIAQGAREALPNCPGFHPKRTIAWYLMGKLFGDRGDSMHLLKRQCNNPFVNSEEFEELDQATAPYALQTEALKAKGEYEDEELDLKPWPPSQVIKGYREAYEDFGPMQKVAAWALPAIAGLYLISAIGQELHPKDSAKARFNKLQKIFEAQTYSPQDYSSFSALAYLSPNKVKVQTSAERNTLARGIQNDLARVSLAGFRQGLDNKGQKVDMYDLAHELIPDETMVQLEKEKFVFKPISPVHCDIRYVNGFPPYDPLDYSNRTPQDFQITTRQIKGRTVTEIPLGSEDVTTSGEQCVKKYSHKLYPPNNSTYPSKSELQFSLY